MANFFFNRSKNENKVDNNAEEPTIKKRVTGDVYIEISLKPEDVQLFQEELEVLCNKYLNMNYEN